MRNRRQRVSKGRSSGKFRSQVKRTKSLNVARPGRGGFRL